MTKWAVIVAGAFGIAVGVGSVVAWNALGPAVYPDGPLADRIQEDHRDYSGANTLPTAALSRALFSRIAPTFVSDTRRGRSPRYGVGFFARPKPFGEFLCRVELVSVPGKVVRGYVAGKKELWEDDLSVGTLYGIRRKPGGPSEDDAAQLAACSRYSDFEHLIWGNTGIVEFSDGTTVERAVNVLDRAIDLAKAGRTNFTIQCTDRRELPATKACDGPAILRGTTLKDINQVDKVSEADSEGAAHHVDEIFLRETKGKGCSRAEAVTLKIASTQTYGRQSAAEGDPTEVDIYQDVIC